MAHPVFNHIRYAHHHKEKEQKEKVQFKPCECMLFNDDYPRIQGLRAAPVGTHDTDTCGCYRITPYRMPYSLRRTISVGSPGRSF